MCSFDAFPEMPAEIDFEPALTQNISITVQIMD